MLSVTVAVCPSGPVAVRSACSQISVSQPGPGLRPARVCAGVGNSGSLPSGRRDQGAAEPWSMSARQPPGGAGVAGLAPQFPPGRGAFLRAGGRR
jgi:hypothetical protein